MLKRLRAAIPLRVSLVAATLVLVACGLAVSGIVVTSILLNSQIRRIDRSLLDASRGWALQSLRVGRRRPRQGEGCRPAPAQPSLLDRKIADVSRVSRSREPGG